MVCPIAGVGSRLAPFTYTKPKAFMKVAGRRLIDHLMAKLQRTFEPGTPALFVVGYKKKLIREYIEANYADHFDLKFVVQKPRGYHADVPYFSGLGAAISLAAPHASGEDVFIFLSDRLPMEDYSAMVVKFLNSDPPVDGIINAQRVADPRHYGVLQLAEDGTVRCIVEKPEQFVSDLAVAGAYLFSKRVTPKLFAYLAESTRVPLEEGEEYQFTPVIERLVREGHRLVVNQMKERILDFGRPENFIEGNRVLLESTRQAELLALPGDVTVVDSQITPPTCVGAGTTITRCNLGPHVSIGENCKLDRCIISNAVIGDGVSLSRTISKNSIIGDYVVLEDLIKNNVTIGDSSCIASTGIPTNGP